MAEKVVSVRLQARVEGFTAGMQKAKASVDDLTKAAAPSKADAFGKMADKAALAGLGVATAVGVAVKRFADFDQAMSAVQANSGATGASLEALRQAAVTMGADSQFSATEAAQGINEMAKAGVDTAAILSGGLKGSLDLAAAGQISVAEAAETAATAMTQFGLEGSKVPHIADLLANASNKAQGGVGDMAQALKQTGLVASSMGLSIEETTAGLTAFASAGLLGSDAGTSFKTMLQRLSNPVGEAKAQMEALNINAYDAQGRFVGLASVAGQLQRGMEKLTPAQRAAAMSVIFGSDAVRAANVLYEQGADGINRWTREVSEQGAAARQAAALTDNLKGDVERLGGALDSVFIQTGSGANGSLRGLTQGITGLVDAVGEVPGPLLLAGGALTTFALVAPKGVLAYRNYVAQLDSLGLSLDKISTKAPRTGRALEGAAAAAKGFSAALAAAAAADILFLDDSGLPIQGLTEDLLNSKDAADAFNDAIVKLDTGSSGLGDTLRTAFDPSFFDTIQHKGNEFTKLLTLGMLDLGEPLGLAEERLGELDQTLSGLVSSGSGEQAQRIFDDIARAAASQGVTIDDLKAKLPQYAEALAGVANAASSTVEPQSAMVEVEEKVAQSAEDAEKALKELRSSIEGLGSPVAQQRSAARNFQAAIDDATASIKENGKTLDDQSDKGRNNQAALDAIAAATREKVAADFEAVNSTKGSKAATEAATKAMKDGRQAFIDAAVAAGSTKTEAEKLATQLGLVPKNVQILVSQSGAAEAEEAINQAARDRTATIFVQRRIADQRDARQDAANSDPVPVRRAMGGYIPGHSPTATADNILIRATAGEYMIRKAAADSLGKATLDYLNRHGRLPGYAAGGVIAGQFAPARLSTSTHSDGFGRGYLSGNLDLGNGLSGYVRGIVVGELEAQKRQKGLAGRG